MAKQKKVWKSKDTPERCREIDRIRAIQADRAGDDSSILGGGATEGAFDTIALTQCLLLVRLFAPLEQAYSYTQTHAHLNANGHIPLPSYPYRGLSSLSLAAGGPALACHHDLDAILKLSKERIT